MLSNGLPSYLPSVTIASTRFWVDRHLPIAILVDSTSGVQRTVTWPQAALPNRSSTATTLRAPNAVWVVYQADTGPGEVPSATAVRIGLDAAAQSFILGALYVIGVDSYGIWATADPVPVTTDPDFGNTDDEGETGDDGHDPATGAVAANEDAPLEDYDELMAADQSFWEQKWAALKPSEWASGIYTTAGTSVTASWQRLNADAEGDDENDNSARPPEPPDAVATQPVLLHRFDSPSIRQQTTASRLVSEVIDDGSGVLTFVYHATGPAITSDGSSWSYSYPTRSVAVPATAALPERTVLDELHSVAVDSGDTLEKWGPVDWDDGDSIAEKGSPVLNLSDIPGSQWALIQPAAPIIAFEVDAVSNQFKHLSAPVTMWLRSDDQQHRVASAYRDVSIRTENVWPEIQVVVEFFHRRFGNQRIRSRIRVFDDAGRPYRSEYLSVYLDEELDTRQVDDSQSTDILELPPLR